MRSGFRHPRVLHPLAWWVWALGLAVAANRTDNPLLLGLILSAAGWVVAQRRVDAPWSRAFHWYLGMAAVVLAVRVLFRIVFAGGVPSGGALVGQHVLFSLPHLPLPKWLAGVGIGGPVTVEAGLGTVLNGMQLGTLICCVGAANALANPKRVLRSMPGALHEFGVAVIVAVTVAPQLVESAVRVRKARRLRAGETGRWRILRSLVIPVLEDALERSLVLAAAMESRGFGRRRALTPTRRRSSVVLLIGGLAVTCIGVFGLLDPTAPVLLGLPTIIGGAAACVAGIALGGGRGGRSRYRPDRWRPADVAVAFCGVVPAVVTMVPLGYRAADLSMSVMPLAWPALPVLPLVAIALAALPAVAAPPPPLLVRPGSVPPLRRSRSAIGAGT